MAFATQGSTAGLIDGTARIGNAWRDSADGTKFDVRNPADGSLIMAVANCGAVDARNAVDAAHEALPGWRSLTAAARATHLRAWHDAILAAIEPLSRTITLEMGKPLEEAQGEIRYGASYLLWYAEGARHIYGEIIPAPWQDKRIFVTREPVGVVAAITPWNFPVAMLARKAAAALAAGCTVVAKPAEDTPLSALALAALAEEAGLPAGVFNVVPTNRPAEVGEALLADQRVAKISFTGSTEVGKLLFAGAASTVKKLSLELGGNAPFIVFADADLDRAVEGALQSKFRNAGQTCVCANRIYVERPIYAEFLARLAARVRELRIGDGMTPGVEIGPLINAAGLAKVRRFIDDALANGARAISGQEAPEGLFCSPVILADFPQDGSLGDIEIFGPVAPVSPFDSEDEVLALANSTRSGLAAYFYTSDLARAWRIADGLEFGIVGINEGIVSTEVAPFGGIKESGFGREGSRHGLEDYLVTKYRLLGGL